MSRTKTEISNNSEREGIIDLLETVLLSKFSKLSREEIEAMFLVSDIKQTRVYQEAVEEGKQEGLEKGLEKGREEGEVNLLLRLVSKRFGKLTDAQMQTINNLTIEKLEELGEALLDFEDVNDLYEWLKSHT